MSKSAQFKKGDIGKCLIKSVFCPVVVRFGVHTRTNLLSKWS